MDLVDKRWSCVRACSHSLGSVCAGKNKAVTVLCCSASSSENKPHVIKQIGFGLCYAEVTQ